MTTLLKRTGAFVVRLGTVAGFIAAVNWVFDYPLTGWAIWNFGPVGGGAIILLTAPILNYGIIHWYRRTTPDWFGMEWLRAQETIQSNTFAGKIIRTTLQKSRLLTFAAISGLLDPTYAFIYQRGRTTGVRFTTHDWLWFGLANVIGILPWITGASIAVGAAKLTI